MFFGSKDARIFYSNYISAVATMSEAILQNLFRAMFKEWENLNAVPLEELPANQINSFIENFQGFFLGEGITRSVRVLAPDDGAVLPLPRYQTKFGVMAILEMNVARIKRRYEQMGLA